jgi:hypothetical protein
VIRLVGGIVAAAVLAGCAAATAPSVPAGTPAAVASAPAAPDDSVVLPWSRDRPLTWDDFRGQAPADGAEGARTVYLMSYVSRCRGLDFEFTVVAVMLPLSSWVKARVLTSPNERARVLQHEQTHFDLTEVHARRMRRYFSELYNPCGVPEDRLKASVDRFVKDEADAQQQYDLETGHGLRLDRQRTWDDQVDATLAELAAFAAR